ncbi:chorismate synthase [Listeria kieliensis]|uniref:Chorismate synthase n=1 Tax=Listeria kieliensis TaxID=1621700 RepID=A0A3D8TQV0_9LIST|nr:chorismate synthase [Listeria kieliensis]RDX01180.1 chorismate synthase [Listeria kieliensis]
MGIFGFFNTPTEQKRDDYDKLHDLLKDAIREHDDKMAEAKDTFSSYKHGVPNMSNSKIPSNDFDQKREKLTAKLAKYISSEADKRSKLVSAKNKAYDKYAEYKAQAIHEAAVKEAKKEKERKEREERLKNG